MYIKKGELFIKNNKNKHAFFLIERETTATQFLTTYRFRQIGGGYIGNS